MIKRIEIGKTAQDAKRPRHKRLVSFLDDLSTNDFIGWVFLVFAVTTIHRDLTNSLIWMGLAKLCWIHADIKRASEN